VRVRVEATDLPGRACDPDRDGHVYRDVHVGVCVRGARAGGLEVTPSRPWRVVDVVPGDAASARWALDATYHDDGDVTGTWVRGACGDRHVGLAWGEVPGDGLFHLFRLAKLGFAHVPLEVMQAAASGAGVLVARLGLTDRKGHPLCASVKPPAVRWSVEPA
jgi:hypothetical protein